MEGPHPPLAQEAAVLLRIDGIDLTVLSCTPLSLEEMAVGHLLGKGLIARREDLASIHICPDRSRVDLGRRPGLPPPTGALALVGSACGGGHSPGDLHGLSEIPALETGVPRIGLGELAAWARQMFASSPLHAKTGGMHCAAFATHGLDLIVREDVGRHNALDKVLGRALLEDRDPSVGVLLSSGRLAADMVAKAVHAGVPILASRSVPTTSAFQIAVEHNLTLVGRILSASPLVYCGRDRLAG